MALMEYFKNKILKTLIRYKRFKPLNLTNSPFRLKKMETGISTEKYSGKIFNTRSGEVIFKTFEEGYGNNEIICSLLANQIGIPCAKYEKAFLRERKKIKQNGIASFYFVDDVNQKLISASKLIDYVQEKTNTSSHWTNDSSDYRKNYFYFYEKTIEKLISIKKNDTIINKDEIMYGLFKILVFDFLTSQMDRHNENISFLLTKKNNKNILSLAPLYDNEYSFGTYNKQNEMNVSDEYFINKYVGSPSFAVNEIDQKYIIKYSRIKNEARDIVSLAKTNKNYMEFLKFAIENLNLKNINQELETKGVYLSNAEFNWYKKFIDVKKNVLIQNLSVSKDNKKMENNNCEKIYYY